MLICIHKCPSCAVSDVKSWEDRLKRNKDASLDKTQYMVQQKLCNHFVKDPLDSDCISPWKRWNSVCKVAASLNKISWILCYYYFKKCDPRWSHYIWTCVWNLLKPREQILWHMKPEQTVDPSHMITLWSGHLHTRIHVLVEQHGGCWCMQSPEVVTQPP